MSIFEIYTKEVTVKTAAGEMTLTMRPLSGRFLPRLYKAAGKLNSMEDEEISDKERMNKFFDSLDEETVTGLHAALVDTLTKSYPNEKKEIIDEFVSQNFLSLFPALFEVNFNNRA